MEYLLKEVFYLKTEARNDYPPVDIYERKNAVVFVIDLPGIETGDVLIKVYHDLLIIEGMKREPISERCGIYICMEREFDSFRRILPIPVPVNPADGRAIYSDGVLTVTLPKPKDRVYKIKIEKE
ncbi:MAG TPA: Hsp20/alpha crystallin family protein [Nitrospirae bacterium]|nr:Hsp20/alpha crystallin family protein [Nitrospirota bacterium]